MTFRHAHKLRAGDDPRRACSPVCQVHDHIAEVRCIPDCSHCLIPIINEMDARSAFLHKGPLRDGPAESMLLGTLK